MAKKKSKNDVVDELVSAIASLIANGHDQKAAECNVCLNGFERIIKRAMRAGVKFASEADSKRHQLD